LSIAAECDGFASSSGDKLTLAMYGDSDLRVRGSDVIRMTEVSIKMLYVR
jgi:hypothetical protein